MENNTMTLMALVMAHASCGHSSFFKNNYLFKDWSDADSIVDYLKYSRNYINKCEEEHGAERVEELLDACHSLQLHGIDRYNKPQKKKGDSSKRTEARNAHTEETFNDLWRTVPETVKSPLETERDRVFPEENLLYFIEKYSPVLKSWEKEIVRIVRKISQYFYPQRQTQLMNEGWATFVHYTIMNMMYDQGLIGAGSVIEFLKSHAGVIAQPSWDSKYFSGINVYALGFAMMQDIKRMCESPDAEDLRLFPNICNTDWLDTMKSIVSNYRDESFVMQFLSPKVVKKFELFSINMDSSKPLYRVTETHDDNHLEQIRKDLSAQYDLSKRVPHLEVVNVDWEGDRTLTINHYEMNGVMLNRDEAMRTGGYLESLWGHDVEIVPVDKEGNEL
jgi:spore cortex formation protein SpoVR/YcgB (stage V sporulation)